MFDKNDFLKNVEAYGDTHRQDQNSRSLTIKGSFPETQLIRQVRYRIRLNFQRSKKQSNITRQDLSTKKCGLACRKPAYTKAARPFVHVPTCSICSTLGGTEQEHKKRPGLFRLRPGFLRITVGCRGFLKGLSFFWRVDLVLDRARLMPSGRISIVI